MYKQIKLVLKSTIDFNEINDLIIVFISRMHGTVSSLANGKRQDIMYYTMIMFNLSMKNNE